MLVWLKENATGHWTHGMISFAFSELADATRFKLVWSEQVDDDAR
jgi:hypothetical protein